jgi:transposase
MVCVAFFLNTARVAVLPNIRPANDIILRRDAYRQRNLIERMFRRLKDWRRIATRDDKLAANFAAAVRLSAVIIWWT